MPNILWLDSAPNDLASTCSPFGLLTLTSKTKSLDVPWCLLMSLATFLDGMRWEPDSRHRQGPQCDLCRENQLRSCRGAGLFAVILIFTLSFSAVAGLLSSSIFPAFSSFNQYFHNQYFQIFPTFVDVLTSSSFVEALVSCAARPWWPWPVAAPSICIVSPGPAGRARSAWCCCWTWHCAAAQFTSYDSLRPMMVIGSPWLTPLWHWVGRKPTGWICFMTLPFFMGKEVRKSDGFR